MAWRTLPWRAASIAALLALTACLYLWGLGSSGWANSFYSAAVEAATKSWKALLFGSFDSSNFITVDKTPASLWVMDISARIFGVNSWSILVPQALEGVAAVGLLYLTVRRRSGHAAGLIAGVVLASMPTSALMFRYNNPDALLVLLLVASAWSMERALEAGRTRWIVLAGALAGLAFLAKMLQAFLVLPVFALVHLLAAPVSARRRLAQLAAGGIAVVASAGWWVALVALSPASTRPYIGGSSDNSILNLVLGYNGIGRLTGGDAEGPGGGGAGLGGPGAGASGFAPPGFGGATGITRMFNEEFGGEISWLIPSALILLGATLWLRRRSPRTDPMRASALLWGGWLVVTALVFSLARGIVHPYYSVALAPAIAALIGMGSVMLWSARERLVARLVLAAAVVAAVAWSAVLLARTPDWMPWLRCAVLAGGLAAAAGVVASGHRRPRAATAVIALALAASLGGSVAYALETATTPHGGGVPGVGPAAAAGIWAAFPPLAGAPPQSPAGGNPPPFPPARTAPGASPPGAPGAPVGPGTLPGPGAPGGLPDAGGPSGEVVRTLEDHASAYEWVAAVVGADGAARYQLATGDPVMAVGGFTGSDPAPALTQFERLVAEHRIHYFIDGGRGGGPPGGRGPPGAAGPPRGGPPGPGGAARPSSDIRKWVQQNFRATTVGDTTMYDLTAPAGRSQTGPA